MSACETPHRCDWTPFLQHPAITDMTARQCRYCRQVEMRVTPPAPASGRGSREFWRRYADLCADEDE